MADEPTADPDLIAATVAARAVHDALRALVDAGFNPTACVAAAHGETARQLAGLWGSEDAAQMLEDTAALLRTIATPRGRALALAPSAGRA